MNKIGRAYGTQNQNFDAMHLPIVGSSGTKLVPEAPAIGSPGGALFLLRAVGTLCACDQLRVNSSLT